MQQTATELEEQGEPQEMQGSPEDAQSRELSLAFSTWHRLLRLLLIVHIPLLALFAYFREVDPTVFVPLLAVPLLLVIGASTVGSERFRAALIAIGFSWCSWLLIFWSGGAIEAHFHALIVIGLVGLYRDVLALGIVTVSQIVLQVGVGSYDPSLIYRHEAAINSPLVWGFIHICAIIAAAAVPVFAWRGTREAADDSAERAREATREQEEVLREQEIASVYATVARRSQTLLERQLDLIDKLEQDEKDPSTLRDLFSLDHLATRMNREAASMLVLAGGEPNRRVVGRPPVSEVARGAIGEIEDYTRVDLKLADDRTVDGRVVAPLVHMLSELVENAASYSPPESRVEVTGRSADDGSYVIQVIDRGIGLEEPKLQQYNHLLANPPMKSPADSQRLGLDVVARLAGRHGLPVQLRPNADGPGTTATLLVPAALLSPMDPAEVAGAPPSPDLPEPSAPTPLLEQQRVPEPAAVAAGRTEDALPAMEPAPPIPVPGAERPAAPEPAPTAPAGAPAWAQATSQAGRPTAAAPAPSSPAPAEPSRPATSPPSVTTPSWSYSGHLTGGEEGGKKRRRRGLFGLLGGGEEPPAQPEAGWQGTPQAATQPTSPQTPPDQDPESLAPATDDIDALLNASRRNLDQSTSPPPTQEAQEAPATLFSTSGTEEGPTEPTGPAEVPSDEPSAGEPSPSTDASLASPTPRHSPTTDTAELPTAESKQPDQAPDEPTEQPTQEATPAADDQAQAAARLLEDLPGMSSESSSDLTPQPSQPPVQMPLNQKGQGPSIPPGTRRPEAPRGAGPQPVEPSGPSPHGAARPAAGQQRPTVGQTKPTGRAEGTRPTVGQASTEQSPEATPAEEPAQPTASGGVSEEPPTSEIGTPLPKRRRGESLPSGLRTPADESPTQTAAAAGPVSREQSRSLLSSYQSRLQAGRRAAEEQVSHPGEEQEPGSDEE